MHTHLARKRPNMTHSVWKHYGMRRNFVSISHLHLFWWGFITANRYTDEVLDTTLTLLTAAVIPAFVKLDDNARPRRALIIEDYPDGKGISGMEWSAYSFDFNIFENLWNYHDPMVHTCFWPPPLPATLKGLKTAQQEDKLLFVFMLDKKLKESILPHCKHCKLMKYSDTPV